MADLSKLSTADLQALQAGNLGAVSTQGLMALQGGVPTQPQAPQRTAFQRAVESNPVTAGLVGLGGGLVKGATGILQAGAQAIGADEAAQAAGRVTQDINRDLENLGTAGQIGGFVGEVAPYVALPAAAPTLAGRIALGAAGGAAQGALQSQETPDMAQRGQSALTGAAIGAVVPVALAGAVKAGGAVARGTTQTAKVATRAITGAKPQNVVEEIVGRSKLSPQELKTMLESGKITTLADVAGDEVRGLTRAVGKIEGGRNVIADALEGRSEGAVKRVIGQLSKNISNVDTYFGNLDDVAAARAKMAAPLYKEAYEANPVIQSKLVDDILDLPMGKQALQRASQSMQNRMVEMGIKDPVLSKQAKAMGLTEGGVARGLNLQSLDEVKKGFDAIYRANRISDPAVASQATALKNKLVQVLDDADVTGKYKQARKVFGDQSALIEAQEQGLKFNLLAPEQIKRLLKDMAPDQREAFRIGVRLNLQKKASDVNTANPAGRIFGPQWNQDQLKAVLGDGRQYKEFTKRMKEEMLAAETKVKVVGASNTDRNLAADTQLENVIGRVARGDAKGVAIDTIATRIADGLRSRYYGLNSKNAEEIARALVNREAGLEALNRIIAKQTGTQKGIVQQAVQGVRQMTIQNANPSTPSGGNINPMRNSQRGSLETPDARIALGALGGGALGAGMLMQNKQQNNNYPRREPENGNIPPPPPLIPPQVSTTTSIPEGFRLVPMASAAPVSQTFLINEEGFRPTAYKDSVGITTIGYGFNLEQPNAAEIIKRVKIPERYELLRNGTQALSDESARKLFDYKHRKSEQAAARIVPQFNSLGENQRAALTSMAYHMGGEGLRKFRQTLAYLADGNAKAVENQLLSSEMAKQTPARAQRTALMLAYNLSPEEAEARLVEQGRIGAGERKYVTQMAPVAEARRKRVRYNEAKNMVGLSDV
jgi:GH24 family phage-related lysozyme (muramidase)